VKKTARKPSPGHDFDREKRKNKKPDANAMSRILELQSVLEAARGTIEMIFKRPQDFDFLAGQNINLKVPELHYPDPKGARRTFTIASAPYEHELIFATRLSGSGYKRTLVELGPGSTFEYIGPNGQFVHDPAVPAAAYLAGGIGITPFRSMLMHGVHTGLQTPTFLFYGNADPLTAAWHTLFTGIAADEKNFTYVPTMTNLAPADPWPGERRWLSANMVAEYLPDFKAVVFFLCGPPAMVTALTEQLRDKGVDEKQIRSESLWGY
jgi:ferredoxin-NADP reductase